MRQRVSATADLAPKVRECLWANPEPMDRRLLAGIFSRIPPYIAHRLLTEWEARYRTAGRRESNIYARSIRDELLPELFPENGLTLHATQGDLAALLARTARHHRVELPRREAPSEVLARMLDEAWWRRALRKRFQLVEHAAIKAGCVHKHAGLYVSDEAFSRSEQHARRMRALLEALELVNEATGEVLSDRLTGAQYSLAAPNRSNTTPSMLGALMSLWNRMAVLNVVTKPIADEIAADATMKSISRVLAQDPATASRGAAQAASRGAMVDAVTSFPMLPGLLAPVLPGTTQQYR